MRTIEWTGQFKRDYKRESKGRYSTTLDDDLFPIVGCLANDLLLEPRYRDHSLSCDWKDYRDCQIKPDFVLNVFERLNVATYRSISSLLGLYIGTLMTIH